LGFIFLRRQAGKGKRPRGAFDPCRPTPRIEKCRNLGHGKIESGLGPFIETQQISQTLFIHRDEDSRRGLEQERLNGSRDSTRCI